MENENLLKFAVIEDNIVVNIILAESKEIAENVIGKLCIEYNDTNPAIIGLSWNSETGFEQPPSQKPVN